jgi:tetratricopeptide (TPR) repeat protein
LNTNQMAISLLEQNELKQAFNLFELALLESRNVQSLNNLAYFYIHEGIPTEDGSWQTRVELAIELLQECVQLRPQSHFPYQLLGEAYLSECRWAEAAHIINQSLSYKPTSSTAYNNLAVAEFHLGHIKQAADYFLLASNDYEYAAYSYTKCLIDLGETEVAKKEIQKLPSSDGDIGDVEFAELFVELKKYQEAATYFAKGWELYWKQPNWVNLYIYALHKIDDQQRLRQVIEEVVREISEDMITTKENNEEVWTEEEKQTHILNLQSEIENYRTIVGRVATGYVPAMNFQTFVYSDCYLFGCQRHGNPEYVE